ncbi:MAG: extracellular solute-binding protein [Alphaproteobacteria bacterium]
MRGAVPTAVGAAMLALASTLAAAQDCEPDYSGVELVVGTLSGTFIGGPARAHAESWEQRTCGTVRVVDFPFGELYQRFMEPMADGRHLFDVITHAPAWHGDFAPYLSEVPERHREGETWADIHPVYRDRLMMWDGRQVSVTIDGDVHTGSYRRDLFEDPLNRAAFRQAYGYALGPPATWDQYYDIAAFFNRPDQGFYGTVEAFARGGQQFWFFFSHAAAYTNHPENPGAMFFDPETMAAQIGNPGWVRGLEDYIRSVRYSPPGALNFDATGIRTIFANGQVAMNIDWGDTGTVAADPRQSQVAGKVGYFLLPGTREIWNASTREWDDFDEVVHSPFMAFGGWVASVPATSPNQEAAWDYVMWLASPENSARDVVAGGTGINPYRISHFTDVEIWLDVFGREDAEAYLDVQLRSIDAANVALDFRIPGYFAYTEALETQLTRALTGEVDAEDALDAVARAWDKLTDDLGRRDQLAAYRASMGLPPRP